MKPTVLIVDDHTIFRRSARRLLQADGFDVVGEAANGASALVQARALRPQLVLLDVLLPDVDGFEVAETLAREPVPPIVILTSSREADDFALRLERTSARGFLPKGELSGAALSALLAASRAGGPASRSASSEARWACSRSQSRFGSRTH